MMIDLQICVWYISNTETWTESEMINLLVVKTMKNTIWIYNCQILRWDVGKNNWLLKKQTN